MMEKNGAISNETPCCGKGCNKEKTAAFSPQQKLLFPEIKAEADAIDGDITKKAIDAVADSSKK